MILIPSEILCTLCNADLTTYSRPSTVSLYTNYGLKKASSFHKKCSTCNTKYYTSYIQDQQGVKTFRKDAAESDHFIISSRTGFEVALLNSFSDLIATTGVTFSGISESYEVTHGVAMEKQRFEEAFFLMSLLKLYTSSDRALFVPQKDDSCRINLEKLCRDAVLHVCENQFLHHKCSIVGCSEGFVMADGVEKVHIKVTYTNAIWCCYRDRISSMCYDFLCYH